MFCLKISNFHFITFGWNQKQLLTFNICEDANLKIFVSGKMGERKK